MTAIDLRALILVLVLLVCCSSEKLSKSYETGESNSPIETGRLGHINLKVRDSELMNEVTE